MSHVFGIVIESLVAVLLMVTIGYCMLLNKRLKRLKADEHSLKATTYFGGCPGSRPRQGRRPSRSRSPSPSPSVRFPRYRRPRRSPRRPRRFPTAEGLTASPHEIVP